MTNYTIPAILTAVIMMTGYFALMPVYDASTVHTTILGNAARPFSQVSTTASLDDQNTLGTFTCPTGEECLITEITLICQTAAAASATAFMEDVDINGVDVLGAVFGEPTDINYMVIGSATVPPVGGDLCHATTAVDNELVSTFALMGAIGTGLLPATMPPVMLNGDETITMLIKATDSSAVTVRATVHGTFTGSTEPAAIVFGTPIGN